MALPKTPWIPNCGDEFETQSPITYLLQCMSALFVWLSISLSSPKNPGGYQWQMEVLRATFICVVPAQRLNQPITQSINHSINQSLSQSITQSTNHSVNQSLNQSTSVVRLQIIAYELELALGASNKVPVPELSVHSRCKNDSDQISMRTIDRC